MPQIDRHRLVSCLKELIAIPSHENQAGMRRYALEALKAAGLKPYVDAAGNVVASIGSGKRSLILNAHMDTVPPTASWTREPFTPTERSGRLYGLGASDCKGNVAALIELAQYFAAQKPPGKLHLTFTAREELGGRSSEELARRLRADAAIVCEGGFDADKKLVKVYRGCRGTSNFWLTFHGKASHSGRASRGVNAITMCSDFIQKAKKTKFGGESELIPLAVKGGQVMNVVPDKCELYVNYRMDPGQSEEQARAAIKALAKGLDCEVRETECLRGYASGADTPLVRIAKKNIAELGYKNEVKICGGSLDSRKFWLIGRIEAISVGVGSPNQAHRPDESISLKGLYDGTLLLARIIEGFLGS